MRAFPSIGLLIILVLVPVRLWACQCGTSMTLEQAEQRSEQIFRARVEITRVEQVKTPHGIDWPIQTILLRVSEVWKGDLPEMVVARTGFSSCDFMFPEDSETEYVIWRSRGHDNLLMIHECLPTQPSNSELVRRLGRSRAPATLTWTQKVGVWWQSRWGG